jgi:hypothetical protein
VEKLHNDELHNLYSSPNIVRVIISRMRGRERCLQPLGRSRRRCEDNIKMDVREIGIDGANWIQLIQDRVQWQACVNTVMNLRVL